MKCMLCGDNIKITMNTMPLAIANAFPNAQPLPGVFDGWEMVSHMSFTHGFQKVRKNNTTKTSDAYYCTVEETEINGTTYRFGDYVEKVKGKLFHCPGKLLHNSEVVQTSTYVEGSISVNIKPEDDDL